MFVVAATLARASLFDLLAATRFRNQGVTKSSDVFHYEVIQGVGPGQVPIYLEADNVSCTQCVWSDGGKYYVKHPYMFKTKLSPDPTPPPTPSAYHELSSLDWTAGKLLKSGSTNIQASEDACKQSCTDTPECMVGLFLNGSVRHGECWLTQGLAQTPRTDFCGKAPGQSCQSFAQDSAPSLPGYHGDAPASGMRSAVPLGGLSAGTVELRGDGTLHEWTIHNAGPHGAAKVQSYPDAYFAMSVDGEARVLQTNPLAAGLQGHGVGALEYSGSHPISKLRVVRDSPQASAPSMLRGGEISVSLFGFSTLKMGDMAASSRPAVAFSLAIGNAGMPAANVSFMFNLPLLVEIDQQRAGGAALSTAQAASAEACAAQCRAVPKCASWNWATAKGECTQQSDVPLNTYVRGSSSGVDGYWTTDAASQCMTLHRPGPGPMHGNVSVCASSGDSSNTGSWGFGTSDEPAAHFRAFASSPNGLRSQDHGAPLHGSHGAVSTSLLVPAGANATLTLTMGWNFPDRDHYNYDPSKAASYVPFGNMYSRHIKGSVDAAWGSETPGAGREGALEAVVADIAALHSPFSAADMPTWLQDLVLNSVSHTRDAMWWQTCPHCHESKDPRVNASAGFGTWRQYEAYDCPDIDSIHNDGERHIPYIMLFPDGTRSKMAGWAGNQGANGMLAEQILNTNPDTPQGRVMSDSSSMFIIYVLELLRWDGDRTTLSLYYPNVKRAAQWQMKMSEQFGVPLKLETTYDILKFPSYQLSAYASAFHLAAMKATQVLALESGDFAFAAQCSAAFSRAQKAMDQLQWVNGTGAGQPGHYAAGSSACTAGVGCSSQEGSFADAFYAQVLAYSVGLGELLASPERLDEHLRYTAVSNCVHNDPSKDDALVKGCPNGLVIMTERGVQLTDLQVWEMATYDHASLALWRGTLSASEAMEFTKGTGTSYSDKINDQWNIAGIKMNDGHPSITSHYGYHMTSWHMLFALSGQQADFTHPGNASLSFAPKFPCAKASDPGFTLPLILPNTIGTISCHVAADGPTYTLELTVGELDLKLLEVNGHACPTSPLKVVPGEPAIWRGK